MGALGTLGMPTEYGNVLCDVRYCKCKVEHRDALLTEENPDNVHRQYASSECT